MPYVKRREFILLIGGAAAAWPLAARAQQSGKVYRIGFLGVTSLAEYRDRVEAVRTGLRRLGYEESKNIVIHYRWADGRYDRLPELAAELVQLNVDVMFGAGALNASPRLGHLHITVDDLPWWWADASDNNTVAIAGLPPGEHRVKIELVDANHNVFPGQVVTVTFTVPAPSASR